MHLFDLGDEVCHQASLSTCLKNYFGACFLGKGAISETHARHAPGTLVHDDHSGPNLLHWK